MKQGAIRIRPNFSKAECKSEYFPLAREQLTLFGKALLHYIAQPNKHPREEANTPPHRYYDAALSPLPI
jgi:hypothetical protein